MKIKQNKQGAVGLIFIVGFLLVGALVLGYVDIGGFYGDDVYVAHWGTIECEKSPSITKQSFSLRLPQTIECKEYTEECEIYLKCGDTSWYKPSCTGRYKVCNLDGKNCGIWVSYHLSQGQDKLETKISVGKEIKFDVGIYATNEDKTIIRKEFNEWKLRSEEYGKDYISGSAGCKLPYNLKDQVEIKKLNSADCLEKGELTFKGSCRIINYITHWAEVKGAVYYDKQTNHNVVCQARTLYEIDEYTFLNGVVKKFQGNPIRNVKCCPNEPKCTDDFEWKADDLDKCTYDYECLNGGNPLPIGNKKYNKWFCVKGFCEKQTFSSECATPEECIRIYGRGYTCDINPTSSDYGTCIETQTPSFCGDGVCDELNGENIQNCEIDCSCPDGESLVITEKKVDCIIGFPLYFGCDIITEKACVKHSGTNWTFWILLILGIIVGMVFLPNIFSVIKALLNKIGLKF